MNKLLRTILVISLALIANISQAQLGDFILTHHAPKHSEIDNYNFEIINDQNGLIWVANRFGVLQYDGREWDFYKTSSSAISLTSTEDNSIYVGCISEFGTLTHQEGQIAYKTLFTSDSTSDHFSQTIHLNGFVYFLSDRSLFAVEHETEAVTEIIQGDFTNIYTRGASLFLNGTEGDMWKVDGLEIEEQADSDIQWGILSKRVKTIGVSLDGLIYEFENDSPKLLPQNDKIEEAELFINEIGWVNDSLIACATIESGVFFLNLNNPNYFELTDYHSGLPDNEVHDMHTDEFGGVWVAHEFGLTRIDPLFPAHSYTNFPGLDGNLIEAQRLHGDLFVNTSLGVFYFSQDSSFKNKVYHQKIDSNKDPKEKSKEIEDTKGSQEKKPKKGFLGGIFKKKKRARSNNQEKDGFLKKLISPFAKKDPTEYVRRVERIMTGVSYQFHHIPGTEGKFRQLIRTNDKILATSHSGIYEIHKTSTEQVIDQPVQFAYVLEGTDVIIISTEDGFLKTYELNNDLWIETSSQHFQETILNAYQDTEGKIWLAGTTHIYACELSDDGLIVDHGYEINNKFYDELSIWEHDDKIYFINSQGYFRLDKQGDKIIRDTELAELFGLPHHHLHNEKNRVWLYNGKAWFLLLPNGEYKEFNYLGFYPDLKYISYDEVLDRYWLVTQDNQLLAYSANINPGLHENYELFIKRLSSNSGVIKFAEEIQLAHDQNNLVIELLKPDYLGILSPEYQYKLEGLNDTWSAWTHANLIDYSFLPSGKYSLHVRVRDAFGQLEESEMLTFRVGKPYWKEPWFYALQVVLLAIIMAITSRLNEDNPKNRILKSGLSILTLIVIIEFLQSVIGAYVGIESTPVVDFLIDAGIAIMIFPLEWGLRKMMFEGGLSFIRKKAIKSKN